MAKCIKRAGIVFFALVISCLLLICMVMTVNMTSTNDNILDLNTDAQIIADKKVILSGDCNQMATQWNAAIQESIDNNSHIEVVLENDWIALPHPTQGMSFGTGIGFGIGYSSSEEEEYSHTGMINIPEKATITLDLNGYTINRNLTEAVIEGKCMWCFGTLNLKDSSFSELDLNSVNDFSQLDNVKCGKIMGGYEHPNSPDSYGGGIRVNGTLNMYGGIICNNITNYLGGGILLYGTAKVNIYNGIIANNTAGTYGGGIFCHATSKCNMYGGIVANNKAKEYSAGVGFNVNDENKDVFNISSGVKIFGNTLTTGISNNVGLSGTQQIGVLDSLLNNGSSAYIGVSVMGGYSAETITRGYEYGNKNTLAPSLFFFSDISGKQVVVKNNEVNVQDNSVYPTEYITWKWQGSVSSQLNGAIAVVPYTGLPYTISSNLSSIYNSDNVAKSQHQVTNKGKYTFYSKDNYLNPTFTFIIADTTPLKKPDLGRNVFLYTGKMYEYLPADFNADCFTIENNHQTDIGNYIAKLTPRKHYTWKDGSIDTIELSYSIIKPGIIAKDNIDYDFIYLENNFRKSYINQNLYHKIDDLSFDKCVLGNIPTNTTIATLIANLRNESKLIKVYNNQGNKIFDGIESNGIIADSVANTMLGTGYKVELYESTSASTPWDIVYLSVLGDINGDGRITASDVSYLRQVTNDSTLLESMSLERQLACMINNKGGVTEVDSEILRNYIDKQIDINKFLKSETASTSDAYTYLSLDRDNMLRKTSINKTNVIGNISVNTSVEMLKTKLAEMGINISAITIYNRKGYEVSDNTAIVGTGWRIEVGGEIIYLSVLGDLTGDGRITAADISYLRAIAASDTTNVQDCILLSAILLNKGGITTADIEVLKQSINKRTDINKY